MGSVVVAWHVVSSRARDRIRVRCIGRLILYHSATREVLKSIIFLVHFISIIITSVPPQNVRH